MELNDDEVAVLKNCLFGVCDLLDALGMSDRSIVKKLYALLQRLQAYDYGTEYEQNQSADDELTE